MGELMYRVLIDDHETGLCDYARTEDGEVDASWSDDKATAYAEKLAEEYFGSDDVTWFEHEKMTLPHGLHTYGVGRIHEDGTRADPTVFITVEEFEGDA